MIRLTDRASGAVLGLTSTSDFQVMRRVLQDEDVLDADYYLTPATLDLLAEQGLGEATLDVLRRGLGDREAMDLGWEVAENGTHVVAGRVLDPERVPVPGLKVEVYDGPHEPGRALGWAFTRADGAFEIPIGTLGRSGFFEPREIDGEPHVGLQVLAIGGEVLLSTPGERMGSPRREYGDLVVEPPAPMEESILREVPGLPPDPALLEPMMLLDRPLERPLGETGAVDPRPLEEVADEFPVRMQDTLEELPAVEEARPRVRELDDAPPRQGLERPAEDEPRP